jgi:hypothetical protein
MVVRRVTASADDAAAINADHFPKMLCWRAPVFGHETDRSALLTHRPTRA